MQAESSPKIDELLSQVYSNRCFAQLMLKNYGSCKEDANRALKRNPNNVKAIYRKAKVSNGGSSFSPSPPPTSPRSPSRQDVINAVLSRDSLSSHDVSFVSCRHAWLSSSTMIRFHYVIEVSR